MNRRRILALTGAALAAASYPAIGLAQQTPRSNANDKLNELLTWGGISNALAEGVIGAVGAKIFNVVLDSIFANKGVDFAALLESFIQQVRDIVHKELLADDKRKLEATAQGLQRLFHDYANTPEDDLLNQLHHDCVLGVSEAQSLELLGVPSYAIIGSLSLAIYQEKFKKHKQRGYRDNIRDGARFLIAGVKGFSLEAEKSVTRHYSGVEFAAWYPHQIGYTHRINGQLQSPALPTKRQASRRLTAQRTKAVWNFQNKVLGDLYRTRDAWQKISDKYS
jgi:hypothetical protein